MKTSNKTFGTIQANGFRGVEIYTKNPVTGETGWGIEFVNVYAESRTEAKQILKDQYPLFDCVICF